MNRFLQRFFIALLLVSPVVLGYLFWKTATPAPSSNANPLGASFQYDISALRKVDPKLIIGTEQTDKAIALDTRDPVALALGAHGQIAVAGADEILVIPASRNIESITRIAIDLPATCLAMDTDDNFYVGHVDHVSVYGPDGTSKGQWEAIANNPILTSIAVDGDNVYVGDAGNKVVHVYNRSGKRLRALCERNPDEDFPGLLIPTPYLDLAISPAGNLWVVNPGRYALLHVDKQNGHVLSSWNKTATGIEGFCGCSNPTHITMMSNDLFVTSEKGIPRIKLYAITGQLLGVIAAPDLFGQDTKGLDLAVDKDKRVVVLDPDKKQIRFFTVHHDSITPTT